MSHSLKKCCRGSLELELETNFSKRAGTPDGFRSLCKTCDAKRRAEKIKRNAVIFRNLPADTISHCFTCKQDKTIEHFGLRGERKSGISPECKECYRQRQRTAYSSDAELREKTAIRCKACKKAKNKIPKKVKQVK